MAHNTLGERRMPYVNALLVRTDVYVLHYQHKRAVESKIGPLQGGWKWDTQDTQ